MNREEQELLDPGRPEKAGKFLRVSVGAGERLLAASLSDRPRNVGKDKRGTPPVPRFFIPAWRNRDFSHRPLVVRGKLSN